MATFYIARSEIITPLPWLTFALPFSDHFDLIESYKIQISLIGFRERLINFMIGFAKLTSFVDPDIVYCFCLDSRHTSPSDKVKALPA